MKRIILITLVLACFGLNAAVTQNGAPGGAVLDGTTTCTGATGAGGPTDSVTFTEMGTISDVNVDVSITHAWRGDLIMDIAYNGTTVVLASVHGDAAGNPNYIATFDSEAATACSDATMCGDGGACNGVTCSPDNPLTAFNTMTSPMGSWTFSVCDNFAASSSGTFDAWSVTLDGDNQLPVELLNLNIE